MSKSRKTVLGILTIWPIFYMLLFIIFTFTLSLIKLSGEPPLGLFIIFPIHVLTMILIPVLLFVYIKNAFKNERIPQDNKLLWALVIFFGNIIAMPIYWYKYIWKEPEQKI